MDDNKIDFLYAINFINVYGLKVASHLSLMNPSAGHRIKFPFNCANDAYRNWKTNFDRDTELTRMFDVLPKERIPKLALCAARINPNLPDDFIKKNPQYDCGCPLRQFAYVRGMRRRTCDLSELKESCDPRRYYFTKNGKKKYYTCECDFNKVQIWDECETVLCSYYSLSQSEIAFIMLSHFKRLQETHPRFNLRCVIANPHLSWNFKALSQSAMTELQFIQDNPQLPWDFDYLSSNPNITSEFVAQNLGEPWNIQKLCINSYLCNSIALVRAYLKDKARWKLFSEVCQDFITPGMNDDICNVILQYLNHET